MGSKSAPKQDANPLDDSATVPTVRGSLMPYVLGTARIGGMYGALGDRTTYKVENDTGSGGKGGGSAPKSFTTYYREKGWTILCLGKGRRLTVLNTQGEQSKLITNYLCPSGSTVELGDNGPAGDMGVFKIYWGEDDQPVNSFLASYMGINSAFPHVFGIVWEPRELGRDAYWPNQEFIVEVDTQFDTLAGYPTYIKTDTSSGVNPAAALYQMMFEPAPFGLGRSTDEFVVQDFYDLMAFFSEEGEEPFPCSIRLSSGTSFKEGIENLLADIGVSWWYDATSGKYRLSLIRAQELDETIGEADRREDDGLEISFEYAVSKPKSTVYSFDDSNRRLVKSTVSKAFDGEMRLAGDPSASKVDLNTVTDYTTANMVAARRMQESIASEEVPLILSAKHLSLPTNKLYAIEGLPNLYRVKDVTPNIKDFSNKVTFIRDAYSSVNNYAEIPQTIINPDILPPEEDIQQKILEVNRSFASDTEGVILLRVRAHAQIVGTTLLGSPDNSTYSRVDGMESETVGGSLSEELKDTSFAVIEEGPIVNIVGPDYGRVVDLSSSEELWRSGAQICVIGNEFFYLRNITIISATQYRLEGLIRARRGSVKETHATGSEVFILSSGSLKITSPTYLVKGANIYIKSLTSSSTGTLQSDDVTPTSLIDYQGGGYRPLAVSNVRTGNMSDYWYSGDDIPLTWSYKKYGTSGAGLLKTGQAAVPESPEGTFTVVILSGTTVKRTVTGLTVPKYTYTNADLQSDFGLEPSAFSVRVIADIGGLVVSSPESEITKVTPY